MTHSEEFVKCRKSFTVAPYALKDVIRALSNDDIHEHTQIVVTKEDGQLVVMFHTFHHVNDDVKAEGHDYETMSISDGVHTNLKDN